MARALPGHRDPPVFGLLKDFRRRRFVARATIPETPWQAVVADIPSLAPLDAAARHRLCCRALLFLHEKAIEPAHGLVIDEAMRLRIALLACRPALELGLDCYDGFASVIVYPGQWLVRGREREDEAGVVHVGDEILSGESWEQGPVLLSWEDVLASGRGDGFDVVAHEFAHKLDQLDGAVDGVPPLHRGMSRTQWIADFQRAYDDLTAALERGEEPWLDPYAAEDPGEFFAVCTELFFDTPSALAAHHPDLYARLRAFYRQDPAG